MIALVLGGAPSWREELCAALDLINDRPHITVACNHAIIHHASRLDAACSLHPDLLNGWFAERAERGGNGDFRVFVPNVGGGAEREEVLPERWPGSSGLYAVQAALGPMGASGAILCGVPMDQAAGHFVHPGPWARTTSYRQAFQAAARDLGDRFRSLGGWTRETFGAPDSAWLDGLVPGRPQTAPATRDDMHHVTNHGDETRKLTVRDPQGGLKLVHLRPGQSGTFDVDPNQAVFARGHLKAEAVKVAKPAAPKPVAGPQTGEVLHRPLAGPAVVLKPKAAESAAPAPAADNDLDIPPAPEAA